MSGVDEWEHSMWAVWSYKHIMMTTHDAHPELEYEQLNVDNVHGRRAVCAYARVYAVGRVPESCCRRHAHNDELVNKRLCLYSTDNNNVRRNAYMFTKVSAGLYARTHTHFKSCFMPLRMMLINTAQSIRILCCVTSLVLVGRVLCANRAPVLAAPAGHHRCNLLPTRAEVIVVTSTV
jgi:hypothetical protein